MVYKICDVRLDAHIVGQDASFIVDGCDAEVVHKGVPIPAVIYQLHHTGLPQPCSFAQLC